MAISKRKYRVKMNKIKINKGISLYTTKGYASTDISKYDGRSLKTALKSGYIAEPVQLQKEEIKVDVLDKTLSKSLKDLIKQDMKTNLQSTDRLLKRDGGDKLASIINDLAQFNDQRIQLGASTKEKPNGNGYIKIPNLTYSLNRLMNIFMNLKDEAQQAMWFDRNYEYLDDLMHYLDKYFEDWYTFYDADHRGTNFRLIKIVQAFNDLCRNNKVATVSVPTPIFFADLVSRFKKGK